MTKMTTEEAFVKVLQMHGIENAFGIIGSAFMLISDLFPKAGITFWDVAHESNGGLIADGYTRSTGKIAMCIAQNGPGVTGLVTPIKTAYWNHTPMLLVTPQAVNKSVIMKKSKEKFLDNFFIIFLLDSCLIAFKNFYINTSFRRDCFL